MHLLSLPTIKRLDLKLSGGTITYTIQGYRPKITALLILRAISCCNQSNLRSPLGNHAVKPLGVLQTNPCDLSMKLSCKLWLGIPSEIFLPSSAFFGYLRNWSGHFRISSEVLELEARTKVDPMHLTQTNVACVLFQSVVNKS